MYVCLCFGVSDKKILELFNNGKSVDDVIQETSATTCCGCCKDYIKSMFFNSKEDKND